MYPRVKQWGEKTYRSGSITKSSLIRWVTKSKLGFILYILRSADRDTSVGIATRYGLDGPGIEFR